jgi:hypothetical protein
MKLIVKTPFGSHQVGDEITDEKEVAAVLASDQASFVTQVESDPPPAKK